MKSGTKRDLKAVGQIIFVAAIIAAMMFIHIGCGRERGITVLPSRTLSVAIAKDTPSTASLPAGSVNILCTKFSLAASDTDISIDSIRIHLTGKTQDRAISHLRLMDGNSQIGDVEALTNSYAVFSGLNLSVSAGSVKTIAVLADIALDAMEGWTIILGVDAPKDIVLKTANASISGTFPVDGNPMNIGLSSSLKVVNKTIHQGANSSFYPIDVWNDPMPGRAWALTSDEKNAESLAKEFLVGRDPYIENATSTDWIIASPWHVTSGLQLTAGDNVSPIIGYGYRMKAQEILSDNSLGDTTDIMMYIHVLPDDYKYPATTPVNGGTINCDAPIVINEPLDYHWWSMYRMEADGSKTYISGIFTTTASATVIVPAAVGEMNGTNYVNSLLQPGSYVLELGYMTTWNTGDSKIRQITLNFNVAGDDGTTGYMCRTIGQRLSGDSGLNFVPLPAEKEARTQADKDRLEKKAMEDFFKAHR